MSSKIIPVIVCGSNNQMKKLWNLKTGGRNVPSPITHPVLKIYFRLVELAPCAISLPKYLLMRVSGSLMNIKM